MDTVACLNKLKLLLVNRMIRENERPVDDPETRARYDAVYEHCMKHGIEYTCSPFTDSTVCAIKNFESSRSLSIAKRYRESYADLLDFSEYKRTALLKLYQELYKRKYLLCSINPVAGFEHYTGVDWFNGFKTTITRQLASHVQDYTGANRPAKFVDAIDIAARHTHLLKTISTFSDMHTNATRIMDDAFAAFKSNIVGVDIASYTDLLDAAYDILPVIHGFIVPVDKWKKIFDSESNKCLVDNAIFYKYNFYSYSTWHLGNANFIPKEYKLTRTFNDPCGNSTDEYICMKSFIYGSWNSNTSVSITSRIQVRSNQAYVIKIKNFIESLDEDNTKKLDTCLGFVTDKCEFVDTLVSLYNP